MTTVFTDEHREALVQYLATHDLPIGLGSEEGACSIAAINLAISGKLTDDIPSCMSVVLGRATIALQDAMPSDLRNSDRYKSLLPQMAGTGRGHESERLDIMLDWLWTTVLPQLQVTADRLGFGAEWQNMCIVKTRPAADAAASAAADAAASAAADDAAAAAAYAASAAATASAASDADADDAANAAADAADAACAVAYADDAAATRDATTFWQAVDPIGVLERMTYLGEV